MKKLAYQIDGVQKFPFFLQLVVSSGQVSTMRDTRLMLTLTLKVPPRIAPLFSVCMLVRVHDT